MKKKLLKTMAVGAAISLVMQSMVFADYDETKAVSYAKENYNNTKSGEYYYYSGKNCTNFVSQCIYAGGIRGLENTYLIDSIAASIYDTITDDDTTYRYWYMKKQKKLGKTYYVTTPNWIRVEEFRRYHHLHKGNLITYTTIDEYGNWNAEKVDVLLQSLEVGDIVQVGDEHSVIISSVGSNQNQYDVLYTAQSNNYVDRQMYNLIEFAKKKNCEKIYVMKFK